MVCLDATTAIHYDSLWIGPQAKQSWYLLKYRAVNRRKKKLLQIQFISEMCKLLSNRRNENQLEMIMILLLRLRWFGVVDWLESSSKRYGTILIFPSIVRYKRAPNESEWIPSKWPKTMAHRKQTQNCYPSFTAIVSLTCESFMKPSSEQKPISIDNWLRKHELNDSIFSEL